MCSLVCLGELPLFAHNLECVFKRIYACMCGQNGKRESVFVCLSVRESVCVCNRERFNIRYDLGLTFLITLIKHIQH